MPIIVLDGPEKAGKTTLANALAEQYGYRVRHWGPTPHDSFYLRPLIEDLESGERVVWDRSWSAECVYAKLLNRNRRARDDWWLMEWLYGRAILGQGIRVIVAGPEPSVLAERRDETDLPVSPAEERAAFLEYGKRFGWFLLMGNGPLGREHGKSIPDILHEAAETAVENGRHLPRPPAYVGPSKPEVLFVGEARNTESTYPGAWLPFATRMTALYGRTLGDAAITRVGWTNVGDVDLEAFEDTRLVVACGRTAQRWVHAGRKHGILDVPHPAAVARWGRFKDRYESVIAEVGSTLSRKE